MRIGTTQWLQAAPVAKSGDQKSRFWAGVAGLQLYLFVNQMNIKQGCSRISLQDFNELEGPRLLGFLNRPFPRTSSLNITTFIMMPLALIAWVKAARRCEPSQSKVPLAISSE
jgi:hypothetical protein